jgi:hypothetical protein
MIHPHHLRCFLRKSPDPLHAESERCWSVRRFHGSNAALEPWENRRKFTTRLGRVAAIYCPKGRFDQPKYAGESRFL